MKVSEPKNMKLFVAKMGHGNTAYKHTQKINPKSVDFGEKDPNDVKHILRRPNYDEFKRILIKELLEILACGGLTVDTELDVDSTNPITNSAIAIEFLRKLSREGDIMDDGKDLQFPNLTDLTTVSANGVTVSASGSQTANYGILLDNNGIKILYDETKNFIYPQDTVVYRGGELYKSNTDIPIATVFTIGTTGATWEKITGVSGSDIVHYPTWVSTMSNLADIIAMGRKPPSSMLDGVFFNGGSEGNTWDGGFIGDERDIFGANITNCITCESTTGNTSWFNIVEEDLHTTLLLRNGGNYQLSVFVRGISSVVDIGVGIANNTWLIKEFPVGTDEWLCLKSPILQKSGTEKMKFGVGCSGGGTQFAIYAYFINEV